MHKFGIICLYCLLVLLSACIKKDPDSLEKKRNKISCAKEWIECQQICEDSCQQCLKESRITAMKDYADYLRQQQIQGGYILKLPRSYRDPLQCTKTTCNCTADYNICVQASGGMVQKRLIVNKECRQL